MFEEMESLIEQMLDEQYRHKDFMQRFYDKHKIKETLGAMRELEDVYPVHTELTQKFVASFDFENKNALCHLATIFGSLPASLAETFFELQILKLRCVFESYREHMEQAKTDAKKREAEDALDGIKVKVDKE